MVLAARSRVMAWNCLKDWCLLVDWGPLIAWYLLVDWGSSTSAVATKESTEKSFPCCLGDICDQVCPGGCIAEPGL